MKLVQGATFLAVCMAAVWLLLFGWQSVESPRPTFSPAAQGWQQAGAANPFANGAAMAEQSAPATSAVSTEPPDLASTSLAGTQPDGDWGVNSQGQLTASRALRQRFDYYLSLAGEMPLASIEATFIKAAKKELSEPALGQVFALWKRYMQLQQHDWKHVVNLQQPQSWSVALGERQIIRRQILGMDVASAFYAEDEAQLQHVQSQVEMAGSEQGSQTSPINTAALHPQAHEREAAVQLQWQQWEQRLEVARSQIKAYALAPELSALQRQQAIERYLLSQFQGTELLRARSLLGV